LYGRRDGPRLKCLPVEEIERLQRLDAENLRMRQDHDEALLGAKKEYDERERALDIREESRELRVSELRAKLTEAEQAAKDGSLAGFMFGAASKQLQETHFKLIEANETIRNQGAAVKALEAEFDQMKEVAIENYVRSRCDNCDARADHDEDGCCRTCGGDVIWADDYILRLEKVYEEQEGVIERENKRTDVANQERDAERARADKADSKFEHACKAGEMQATVLNNEIADLRSQLEEALQEAAQLAESFDVPLDKDVTK